MRTARLGGMTKGGFVGAFSPTVLASHACEVGVRRYRAGDREAAHLHKVATEVTVVVAGRVRLAGREFGPDDIVVLDPGTPADFEVLEDAVTVVVKLPCVAGDKYPHPVPGDAA